MKTTDSKSKSKWLIDLSHSEIDFNVRHLMISHIKGTFKMFDADIYTIGNDFTTADINLWINAASINTNDTKRDEHLKGVDFFDVKNHKQISFTSNSIGKQDEDGNHELLGELTIKGITRNVTLNVLFGGIVNDPWKNEKAKFAISGIFNRSDWDLIWDATIDSGDLMKSNEVIISCEIQLVKVGQKDIKKELNPAF
jgi:polyisoprenoid-binding protein YceI